MTTIHELATTIRGTGNPSPTASKTVQLIVEKINNLLNKTLDYGWEKAGIQFETDIGGQDYYIINTGIINETIHYEELVFVKWVYEIAGWRVRNIDIDWVDYSVTIELYTQQIKNITV